jgi:hypothetical protein
MHARLLAVVGYLMVMALLVYAVFDRGDAEIWLLPVLVTLQVAVGFAIGRWWALVLPVLVVLIAVPAKNPPITPDSAEPFPLFVTFAAMAIVAVPLVAVGLTLRWVHDRRALEGL